VSRNLCSILCQHCPGQPALVESPRPITREEAGVYFGEYQGMLVANAECPTCLAKYLAWVGKHPQWPHEVHIDPDLGFHDLSYRAAFNDEPAEEDLPVYDVKPVRVGPYSGPEIAMFARWREQDRLALASELGREFGRAAASGEDLT
jgi:hypothetical protein